MEVVDGETGRCKQQTGQNWDGPVDGVVVLGGVNHFFHGGKKLIGLELVDRIVPEQTDRFIWKSQVYFEDRHRQFLKIKIDKMRIDAQVLLLFGVEDVVLKRQFASRTNGDFGPLMNPDW